MSSEISTDSRPQADSPAAAQAGMQPWQFFVLAGLGCATAVTFLVRGQGLTAVLLLSALMAATTLVGIAALRTVRPLVSSHEERGVVVGTRTRAALEQEKATTLRTIKELEFDRAMGKMSEEDFREMSVRLRARAARLMKQLDAGSGFRTQIEQDLAKRLGAAAERKIQSGRTCGRCHTLNDADAKFCKSCGEKLA